MAARFRIDQTGPGPGTLDRTRTDLVPNQAINLVVPSPVVGASYSWEIIYKFGSTASLSASTGTSVSIGPGGSISYFCGFIIQLTETIGPVSTKRKRIAAVRGSAKNLRPLMFGETANPNSTRTTRNVDDSTDNESRTDIDNVTGDNSQSWTGWIEAMNEALMALEDSSIAPFSILVSESLSRIVGGNSYQMERVATDPDAPGTNCGLIYTKESGGATHLFYRGKDILNPLCLTDGSMGGAGTVIGVDPSTPAAILIWDSVNGTQVAETPGKIYQESAAWLLSGLHSFEFEDSASDPAAPGAAAARLYARSDGMTAVQDLFYIKADSTIVPITRGNTLARLYPFQVADQEVAPVLENGYGYGLLESIAALAAPGSGGRLFVLTDAYSNKSLHYITSTSVITRFTVPGSSSLPGTAMTGVAYSASHAVLEGEFARFDVSGGNCTATLDSTIPIGGSCVVKLAGAAGGNQVDIVDGAAANIDGVATYSLTTDNQAVRLTKMEDGTWAVG